MVRATGDDHRVSSRQLHPQQPRVHDLAQVVGPQRHRAAAVQGTGEDEVQRADPRQLVAGDRALDQVAVVLGDPLLGEDRAQRRVAGVVPGDDADVAGVALVAGAAVGDVGDSHGATSGRFEHLHPLHDVLPRYQAGPDGVQLLERRPRPDPGDAGRTVVVERHALGEHLAGLGRVRAARGIADDELEEVGVVRRRDPRPPHRGVAGVLDDVLGVAEVGALQPLSQERESALGLGVGVGPGVGELRLADEPGAVAHVDLERRRTLAAGAAGDPHAVRTDLLERHPGEVGGDVGGQVGAGVEDLVDQLLADRADAHLSAGAGRLGEDRGAVLAAPRRSGTPASRARRRRPSRRRTGRRWPDRRTRWRGRRRWPSRAAASRRAPSRTRGRAARGRARCRSPGRRRRCRRPGRAPRRCPRSRCRPRRG